MSPPRQAQPPSFSVHEFRTALGMFATGVTIVTARTTDGKVIGLTANSFNSVSLDPPLVLWSLSQAAASLPAFRAGSHYAINVLAAEQKTLAERFALKGTDRWAGVSFVEGMGGAPLLAGAAALLGKPTAVQAEAGESERRVVVADAARGTLAGFGGAQGGAIAARPAGGETKAAFAVSGGGASGAVQTELLVGLAGAGPAVAEAGGGAVGVAPAVRPAQRRGDAGKAVETGVAGPAVGNGGAIGEAQTTAGDGQATLAGRARAGATIRGAVAARPGVDGFAIPGWVKINNDISRQGAHAPRRGRPIAQHRRILAGLLGAA